MKAPNKIDKYLSFFNKLSIKNNISPLTCIFEGISYKLTFIYRHSFGFYGDNS